MANNYIIFRLQVVRQLMRLNDGQLSIFKEEIDKEIEKRRKNQSRKVKKVL